MDISQLSNTDLMAALGQQGAPDVSSLSDADLMKAIGQQQPQVSTAGDIAKSGGIGLAKGLIGLAGLPGDMTDLASRGYDYLTGSNSDATIGPYAKAIGSQNIQNKIEGYTGKFYTPKTTAGDYAQTIGEFAPAIVGGPESLATKLATRVVAPAVASEAAGQVSKGTGLEPYARVAGAVLGAGAPSALSRVVSPTTIDAANAGAVNALQKEGVTALTAGQKSGSRVAKYMESELGDSLGAGNAATNANELAHEQFTQAALRKAGVNAPRATSDIVDQAFSDNSDMFNSVAQRNPVIPVPKSFWGDADTVANDYENLMGQKSPLIAKLIDRLQNPAISPTKSTTGGTPATISGEAYQGIQSDIARYARASSQPELKMALYDLRASLDKAVGQGLQMLKSPDLAAWQQARQQYKNLLIIEKAISGTSEAASKGLITPAALAQADKSISGTRAFVRGTSNYSELARAGNAVMKPLPQSGTAPRAAAHLIPSLLGAGLGGALGDFTGVLGGIAAPALLGRAIMSRPVQSYLSNQVAVPLRQIPLRRNAVTGGLLSLQGNQQSN